MREPDVIEAMRTPWVSFDTDSGARAEDGPLSESKSHPRAWGSFPRILGRYVRDEHLLTLEEAIRKMTSLPATHFRLANRGTIRPGYAADIVVLDPSRVADTATFESPHGYATGIPYVLVNGVIAVRNGTQTDARPGQVLANSALEKR